MAKEALLVAWQGRQVLNLIGILRPSIILPRPTDLYSFVTSGEITCKNVHFVLISRIPAALVWLYYFPDRRCPRS
jgi:uncharacterized membrane protein